MLLNLHEFEAAAEAVVPKMIWDFIAGGSGDELTVRANRRAFDQWSLIPRVMTGVEAATTSTTVLGRQIEQPVIVGPTSLHRLVTKDGELATAQAIRRSGTIYTVSCAASTMVEEIGSVAGPWWFQVYIFRDRDLTADLVTRAVASGASAIVLTVDLARFGRREASARNRFQLPVGVGPVNLSSSTTGATAHDPNLSNLLPRFGGEFESALTWLDLEWLIDVAQVPVLVKGILHPDDAELAIDHGAAGVIVSNHGGRQLDGAIASLDALPAVSNVVNGRAEIFVDGGVRRCTDILKALALGAKAVLIGRPVLWGLAVDGSAGVEGVLNLLRSELETDMMLCGLASVDQISEDLVARNE